MFIKSYDEISRNRLQLFKQSNVSQSSSKAKQKMDSVVADRKLFSRLFIACQSRTCDLEDFFSHENHSYPISISEYGKLRKCTGKSDFLKCLNEIIDPSEEQPVTQAKIIDGAALINMNPPPSSKVFGDYCLEIKSKIEGLKRNGTERVDLVFDIYKENSLKFQTRQNRGQGTRIAVRETTPIPKDFQKFVRNDKNKNELFQMLVDYMVTIEGLKVVCTKMTDVVSNTVEYLSGMKPCNHEEADTRLLLHVIDACNNQWKKITIVTVDTDIVVIALYHYFSLDVDELWIELGAGKNKR